VVGTLKVGGVSGTDLTKAILDRLINLQNGSDLDSSYHTHDSRYFTKTQLGSVVDSNSGADNVGLTAVRTQVTVQSGIEKLDTDLAAAETKVGNLVTLSGVAANATDLGNFSGGTIPDNQTIKSAIQSLETALESHLSDAVDAHDASAISFDSTGLNNILGSQVQLALSQLDAAIGALPNPVNYTVGNHLVVASHLSGIDSELGVHDTIMAGKLDLAGGTMSGQINMGTYRIVSLGTPIATNDAATKAYVDQTAAGLDIQPDVIRYVNSNTFDPGATPSTGDRYILDSATYHANFGVISGFGQGDIVEYSGSAWVVDFDVSTHPSGGLIVWSSYDQSFYNWSGTAWSQFGGLAGINAGIGLEKVGNTLNVLLGAGIKELPTDEIGLDLATNSGLELTSELTGGQLRIKAYTGVVLGDNGLSITLSPFSTSDLSEGTNLYFTVARAKAAAVADSITDGVTDVAPSQNAVYDALALKANDSVVVKSVNGQTPVAGAVTISTTHVSEGTNLYFTQARVRSALLSGLVAPTAQYSAPTSSDSVEQAVQKLSDSAALAKSTNDTQDTSISTINSTLSSQSSAISSNSTAISNLQTLSGRPANSTHLGTFSGSIISDNTDIKTALQELELAIESIPVDASGVTYTPADVSKWTGSVDPGNVNGALDQLASRVTAEENKPADGTSESIPVGEAISSAGVYAVRFMKVADAGFTAGRVIRADKDASSVDNFWVVGLIKVATTVSAGDSVTLFKSGKMAASGHGFTVGQPIFLHANGTLTNTEDESAGMASVKVGIARDANTIEIGVQVFGVN
jgi:hypothetical protein